MAICPGCGEENPDRFRLCGFCGTPLAAVAASREVRKTVTIVFSDLKGSTSLGEALDSESLREVMNRYFDEMRRAIERHGGTVEKFIGDAVMAVFGLPIVHEDDALRAVRAAWDMRTALADLNSELERRWGITLANRTGVNTGEVVANDAAGGQRLVTGDTVNVAARLEQAAPELEILIGESTHRLVRAVVDTVPVEPLVLKGKSAPVAAHLLRGVRSGAMLAGRPDAPLVGREQELAALRRAFDDVTGGRGPRLVTLLAQPGVGKSRLLREFLDGCGEETTVLRGTCLSYGEGITFWPLAEAIRGWVGISEGFTAHEAAAQLERLPCDGRVRERIGSMMGVTPADFSLDEIFWAVRELLSGAAAERPVVVVFEDVHWAEETLLDLIAWLMAGDPRPPVLMLATSRPDLLDRRPDWCEQDCCTRLRLHPLTGEQSVLVAENALGALDESTRRVVADAAEGNPLFVEQMLSMLIDNGLLVRRDGRWTPARSLAAIEVPPTIHALVAARIDRLPAAERSALEPAAVIGRVFYREAIEGLDGGAPADVDRRLGALIRKEYIEPERSTLVMGDSFQFVHGLIQDAAYRGLLKRRRADLHEAFAGWVLEIVGDRLAEYEEIVGHHLEHAGRYLAELGTADDRTRALGRRAAELLGSAGRRALARGDMSAAAGLLRRAREALAADDPGRLGLVFDLTEVLVEQGEFAEAELLLDESAALSAAGGDVLRETEVRLARLVVSFAVAPASWGDDARHEIEQAISTFSRIGHEVGIAKGWRLLGTVHGARCRYAEAEHAVEQTILHARAAGDALLELRNHAPYAFIALAGPMPVPHAIERCRSLIEDVHGDRRTEGVILCALSQLEAMRGGFDEARAGYRRARQVLAELGVRVLAASVSLNAGPVEMLAGDPAAAERELRRDALALEAMGERYLFPCVVAFLSHAVLEQGRLEEAGELALRCADLSAPDDIEAQNLWRRVWARVLASTGRGDEAERFATAAIEFAERTDSPVMQADSLADLAAVLLLQGRRDAADEASAAAVALYRAKGSTVAADRLRARAAAKPG